jgi:hypothetical protein
MWRIYCGQMPLTGLYHSWEEARRNKARLQGLFTTIQLTIIRV